MRLVFLTFVLGACTDPNKPSSDSGQNVDTAVSNNHALDTANAGETDTGIGENDLQAAPVYAIMPIHLDPGAPARDRITGLPNTTRPESYFRYLIDITEKADEYDFKLTLMFTPQWAQYITSSACELPSGSPPTDRFEYRSETPSDCLELVHAFATHGHEIAMHHHPLDAPSGWDGYTDETNWTADRDFDGIDEAYFADGGGPNGADPLYLGTTADLMALVGQLQPEIDTGIVTATTEEFPDAIYNSVAGGPEAFRDLSNPGDLLSQPCATDRHGHAVWELRMRLFTTESTRSTVLDDELDDALTAVSATTGAGWVFGFVTHASNVAETNLVQYADLFARLSEHAVQIRAVSQVMQAFERTQNAPADMVREYPCPT